MSSLPASTVQYLRAEHIARNYDRVFAGVGLFAYDQELLDAWFPAPCRLLDIGCGTGRHVTRFARRGFEVTGLDLSAHMLDVTRAKLAAEGLSARLVHANMLDLDRLDLPPFGGAICMFSTLGMAPGYTTRRLLLEAARRRVQPGGVLAFHVHNALRDAWSPLGPLRVMGYWLAARRRGLEFGDRIMPMYRAIPNLYLHLFTEGEVRRVVADAGWAMERMVFLNEPRNGPLRGRLARAWRANGFIVLARNPHGLPVG
jgi:SAM-dependent methyltransferase